MYESLFGTFIINFPPFFNKLIAFSKKDFTSAIFSKPVKNKPHQKPHNT